MNPFNGHQMFFSSLPQIIKPGLEVALNTTTYPSVRPIDRDDTILPELQYNRFTSPAAIWLGTELEMSPRKIDHFLEGTFGRTVKYVTGKPGAYSFVSMLEREMYFQSSRQVQFYYETRKENSQKIKAMEAGLKTYSDDETNLLWNRDSLISEIDALLEEYKLQAEDPDQEENAMRTRNFIFLRIEELEALK